jgi:hypothetical protein
MALQPIICVVIVSTTVDDPISKLPKYVFRRANGSCRYKRNVHKALRELILKATVCRQLGYRYDEAIRRLPVVHAKVEALFDQERSTPNSVRAKSIVRERLDEWHAEVFADGVVDPEWDITNDFRELAIELEGSTPPEVVRQVGSARLSPEPMTLHKVLSDYYAYKCDDSVGNKALKTRMAPNSVLRTVGVIKTAMNHVIIENSLEQRNVFQGIKIKGAGASKDDRLPISDDQLEMLLPKYQGNPIAYALFVTLADTGAEVVGIEAQDLDLATGCLHIRHNSLRRLKTKSSDSSRLCSQIPTQSSHSRPDLWAVMQPPPCS